MNNKPLFIFEMANNHQGSVEHGKKIIREIAEICIPFRTSFDFAIKFQYRNLDTFIHPQYQDRYDVKNIKRFLETRLSPVEFQELLEEVRNNRFITMCTPFDEDSVDLIVNQNIDIIKIASCSFTDWPLLEKIAESRKSVIASCAGTGLEDIQKVVSFMGHRNIDLSLMHCVAEYPTEAGHLQMNQINYLQQQFPKLRIGFSTHEDPNDDMPIRIAVAKGAQIFEKHVGVETDVIKLNGYSATPAQIKQWLQAAYDTFERCGSANKRYQPTDKEMNDLLALKRGVFAKDNMNKGDKLSKDNTFYAFPCQGGQVVTSDVSKYSEIILKTDINKNETIQKVNVNFYDSAQNIRNIVHQVLTIFKKSGAIIPENSLCSLSHHFGIEQYESTGVAIIECINREYCKKILVVLPGQQHPSHYHLKKEETFTVLWGQLIVIIDGEEKTVNVGDQVLVERGKGHSFSSDNGCVFEEISTTHYAADSYYDTKGFVNPRKTNVYLTQELIRTLGE